MGFMKGLAFSGALLSVTANADILFIDNANGDNSFEAEGARNKVLQGWNQEVGVSGVFNGTTEHFTVEPDGNTIYLNKNAKVSQLLGNNLELDTVYTITFDIYDHLNKRIPVYAVTLLAGDTPVFQSASPAVPAINGGMISYTGQFDSTGTAYAGETLTLAIETTGRGQINIDNIAINTAASDADTGSASGSFGEWQHPAGDGTSFSVNTTYEAESDGFITYYNDRTCSGNIDLLHVGDASDSVNMRVNRISGSGGMMGVVKKGQFWRVTRWRAGDCIATIGFLPLNGTPTE